MIFFFYIFNVWLFFLFGGKYYIYIHQIIKRDQQCDVLDVRLFVRHSMPYNVDTIFLHNTAFVQFFDNWFLWYSDPVDYVNYAKHNRKQK